MMGSLDNYLLLHINITMSNIHNPTQLSLVLTLMLHKMEELMLTVIPTVQRLAIHATMAMCCMEMSTESVFTINNGQEKHQLANVSAQDKIIST